MKTLIMLILFTSVANAGVCNTEAETAKSIMIMRQEGAAINDVMALIDYTPYEKYLIKIAYEEPIIQGAEGKEIIENEFKLSIFMACKQRRIESGNEVDKFIQADLPTTDHRCVQFDKFARGVMQVRQSNNMIPIEKMIAISHKTEDELLIIREAYNLPFKKTQIEKMVITDIFIRYWDRVCLRVIQTNKK